MLTLARLSIRRPGLALALWTVVGVALAVVGLGVTNSLSPPITVVPGTQSARAERLSHASFGPTQLVPILLRGPAADLNREGPPLVRALARRPHTRVMSAWDGGAVTTELRRSPNAAMIVVSVDRSEQAVVQYDQPQIESLVSHEITAPVRSFVTGQPSIDRAEQSASISDLRRNELIAVGILFGLLLLGLRTPVAAALVTAVGAISMLAGFGLVALLGHVVAVDPVAVTLGTMTGLGLAVGFALLILERFRRELPPAATEPADPRARALAATETLQTSGRAVLVGGTALVAALLIVSLIGPTELMVSLGIGMLVCALFATGGAVVVMPAALVLLGRRVESFRFPAPPLLPRLWARLVGEGRHVTRFAVVAGGLALLLLAALAVPARSLKSGPPSVTMLPASSPARIAFEEVNRVMGAGFATPYNVIVASPTQPITTPALLASVTRFEHTIARVPVVDSVTGPEAINSTAQQLKPFGPSLKRSAAISDRSRRDLLRLINGLGLAGSGSRELQQGLTKAASGSGQLATGSSQIGSGAGQLGAGLAQAKSAASTGFGQILDGVRRLKAGAGEALAGAQTLRDNIGISERGVPDITAQADRLKSTAGGTSAAVGSAKTQVGSAAGAVQQAAAALAALPASAETTAAADALRRAETALGTASGSLGTASSQATAAVTNADNLAFSLSGIAPEFQTLRSNTSKLADGIRQLEAGNATLAAGVSGGGSKLDAGFSQLIAGANQLQYYLAKLTDGARLLANGLAAAPGGAGQLVAGLNQMQAAVIKSRRTLPSTAALHRLFRQSPGMFSSGYFVLAAIDGAPATQRVDATFAINLLGGGTAAQMLVVSRHPSTDPQTLALGGTLTRLGREFAVANHVQLAIGGPEGSLGDLTSVTRSHIWLDVAVIAAAIALTLGLALRAVLLPLVASAFGLLVAGAMFGVLSLLFSGADPLLGGSGAMDPMTIIGVFTMEAGITAIFSALLLLRTREAVVQGAPVGASVRLALQETAASATGAGLLMIAALIPFALTDLINIRQFGVGLAVALALDVLLLRPVLLPAAEVVLGRAGWWPTRVAAVLDAPTLARPGRAAAQDAPTLAQPGRPAHRLHRHPRPGHR